MKKLFNLKRVDLQLGVIDSTAAVGDVDGAEIDTLNYNSGIVLFNINTDTAGTETTYSIKVQHSDTSGSGYEDVDTDLIPLVTGGADDDEATEQFEVPFNSLKRYVRVVATLAENAADYVVMAYGLGDKDYMANAEDFLDN